MIVEGFIMCRCLWVPIETEDTMQQIRIELAGAGPQNINVGDEAAEAYYRLRAMAGRERVYLVIVAELRLEDGRPHGWRVHTVAYPTGLPDAARRVGPTMAAIPDDRGRATLTWAVGRYLETYDIEQFLAVACRGLYEQAGAADEDKGEGTPGT